MNELAGSPYPLVTVAIPVYNGEAYLRETLISVLSQSYQHLEVLVVDDGSSDRSLEIVSSIQDPRLRLLRAAKNEGIERAWNRCLEAASGRYLTLVPQDDLLFPSAIQRRLEAFEQNPRAALVFNARQIINEKGAVITTRRAPFSGGHVNSRKLIASCILSGMNHIGDPAAVMISTAVARHLNSGFSGRWPWVIDLEFWTRLLQLGEACYLPSALSAFRVNRGALSVRLRSQQAAQFDAYSHFASELYDLPRWFLWVGRIASGLSQRVRNILYRFK